MHNLGKFYHKVPPLLQDHYFYYEKVAL